MSSLKRSLMENINEIDVEDLQYVETDLCFHELVSLAFLLYGDDRSRAQYIVQRLIILSQNPPKGKGIQKQTNQIPTSDILRNYALSNPQSWRLHIIEALAIIRAKRVLRKLGLPWLEIYHHFLPHIAEISVHIHPLLKALYVISERLTPDETSKLILKVNTRCNNKQDLNFFDFSYLEIFLLSWLNNRIIQIGDRQLRNYNVEILIEYFKLNDMEAFYDTLLETVNQNNQDHEPGNSKKFSTVKSSQNNIKDSGISMSKEMLSIRSNEIPSDLKVRFIQQQSSLDYSERYTISRENAGYVLIINQCNFYKETDPKLRHLVPFMHDSIPTRKGTNVDRDKLEELFTSFGYKPLVFENLTHLEILHQIRETVKKSLLKDSLIICILSHGMEGVVFGCNAIPVALIEIKEILTADTLKGKPKMLIIQACQRNIATVDTRSSTTSITDFSADSYADLLLAMSSIPGTDALRHTEYGSWFVDSLYKFTQKYGDRKHMLDILTAVTCDISKRKGDANQVMLSSTSSTMRKEFYLPSRL